jgi:hypothetical protein
MCPDCNGTGFIETETIHFGRPYWKDGQIVCDVTGKGNWSQTQCPCIGEDE